MFPRLRFHKWTSLQIISAAMLITRQKQHFVMQTLAALSLVYFDPNSLLSISNLFSSEKTNKQKTAVFFLKLSLKRLVFMSSIWINVNEWLLWHSRTGSSCMVLTGDSWVNSALWTPVIRFDGVYLFKHYLKDIKIKRLRNPHLLLSGGHGGGRSAKAVLRTCLYDTHLCNPLVIR